MSLTDSDFNTALAATDTDGIYNSARGTAVKILCRYESSDSYIDKLLHAELDRSDFSAADKALITEIVNGSVRWLARLDWVLYGFYHGEFSKCLPPVRNALRISLYQLLFLSKIPPHAAINESVEIVKRLRGDRHAGIVNGVLRNILRNIQGIRYPPREENVVLYHSTVFSHPQWLVRRYHERYGEEATEALLNANNHRPTITLRVNTMRTNVQAVSTALTEAGIPFEISSVYPDSVVIAALRDIRSMPLFTDGLVTVQDASASLAIVLANVKAGMLVYDLCAAPGSKAVHAAEIMHDNGRIVALDKYEFKLHLIEEACKRSGISIIEVLHADAREYTPTELADIVLVDAPCSGMGTLSKRPDIKWRRDVDTIRNMARLQVEILLHAMNLVKPGGVVVYSTCTIEPEENVGVVQSVLEANPGFKLDQAEKYLPAAVCSDGFMQTLPHVHHCDGAFAARLLRTI